MTTTEKIKIWILALLMIAIVVVTVMQPSNAQTAHLRYHKKLQNERSFETWKRNQPKVRINAVREAKKQSKAMNGKNNQTARLIRKEERIRKGIVK